MEQSELDLINAMLSAIGDFPVVDLADDEDSVSNIDADVLKARTLLRTINSELQMSGWWFNTETWNFVPDVDTYIILPTNTLRIKSQTQYTKRGDKLYDQTNHSYTIDEEDLDLDLVLELEYDKLPYSFYAYLKNTACLRFFLNEDGDPQQTQLLGSTTTESFRLVQNEDLQFKNPNMLVSNPTVSAIFNSLTNRRR